MRDLRLVVCLFVLALLNARAWAVDWYVCPDSQGEYGLEDGTSLANCFDGNADIGWASINAGDTLYMCGDWLPADARITVADSGSAGSYITISGNASACGRSTNSTISRSGLTGASGRAIAASNTAATRQYIKIADLAISDCSDYCILWDFSTTGALTDDTALWVDNVSLSNGGTAALLFHRGQNLTVTNSNFDYCSQDCIFNRGKNVTITGSTFDHISWADTGGDGMQLDGTTDGGVTPQADTGAYIITGNTIDHTDVDVKYGMLIGPASGTGSVVTVTDNIVYGYLDGGNVSTSNEGILVEANDNATTIRIERNYVYGGRFGISLTGFSAGVVFTTRARMVSNVVHGQNYRGLFNNANVDDIDVFNNTIYGADNAGYYNGFAGTPDVRFHNNILYGNGDGAFFVTAPSTRTHNNYRSNTTNISASGVSQATTTGDITTDPQLVGGPNPSTLAGFRQSAASPVRGAGTLLGPYQDVGNRAFKAPISMGAWEAASGDAATTRTAASTRTAATTRTAASARTAR